MCLGLAYEDPCNKAVKCIQEVNALNEMLPAEAEEGSNRE